MRRLVGTTTNLLRLFEHQCGLTEVPAMYNFWSGMSMIAACVANRVWLEKFRGKRLYPNLYVALIGPSGIGKGEAIDHALKFVGTNDRVNVYAGMATAQHLTQRMGRPRKSDDSDKVYLDGSKLYLVSPEASMSLGSGERADTFIKYMTELYSGRDYPLRDGTVTRGEVVIRGHCINWILGSTQEWLVGSVPKEAISGGFFGRTVAIYADYDFNVRYAEPDYPPDYDEAVGIVQERVDELVHVEGQFTLDVDARELHRRWYETRPAPEDPALAPAWRREDDLIYKLAMVFSLADGLDLVIKPRHVDKARQLSALVQRGLPALMTAASQTKETAGLHEVRQIIKRSKAIQHSALLKIVSKRGINAEQLAISVETLVQSHEVLREQQRFGRVYTWRRRLAPEAAESAEA